MKNFTNHTIVNIYNNVSIGHSIDLDYNGAKYSFTNQSDGAMLVYYINNNGSEIMGNFQVMPNLKDIKFIFWGIENDLEFPIKDLEQLNGLGLYLQFDTLVNEMNE